MPAVDHQVPRILNGAGAGEDFNGIIDEATEAQPVRSDTSSDAILKAATKIRLNLYEPDGVVVHPSDWETIRLERTIADGQYVYGPPSVADPNQIWAYRVVVSPLAPQGTAVLGAFRAGCQLWDREQARVDFSESHLGLFTKNEIIFRGEERIAFAVTRPGAFAVVTGL